MWIVRLALRNPYSVAVVAAVLFILGVLGISSMLLDVFPIIDIPIVGVIWSYPGLTAEEMERRVVTINERAFSTTVQGVEHIESQSIPGIGNIRIYFQPGTDIGSATAEVTAVCQTLLRIMPPGITPPAILPFNASNVPVAQLTIDSDTLPEQNLFDYTLNFIRIKLFTIPGLATPAPYGGANRQINIDVDPRLAAAHGISPQDVSNVLQNSNLILPAGIARIGTSELNILTNASPAKIDEFKNFPLKVVNGREVRLGDVAQVEDGHADQMNAVRINGKRAIYLNILKKADASTLQVVQAVKDAIPSILKDAPNGMRLKLDFDQSIFVKGAIGSVFREALLAALLVSLMILLFLGSWRSVIIVCTSIPLSILASIIGLKITGDSINVMTLGGLALSIGMLVDDATVEIENINRNRPTSTNITAAILKGASQIALPAIVTTLAICIVFFPIVLLTGPAKFLFTPLAKAVVFSMLASYILSRTLVPVLSRLLLRNAPMEGEGAHHRPSRKKRRHLELKRQPSRIQRFSQAYNQKRERALDSLKDRFGRVLQACLSRPKTVLLLSGGIFLISLALPFFVIGRDFFPVTDTGILKMHFRAPPGSRLEETERVIAGVEARIRAVIPPKELETINSMIGIPTSYNLAFVPTDNAASMDAEILIALKEGHAPSEQYRARIRQDFAEHFPGAIFYFQPADIVSQVLNFGLTAPIDVQFESRDTPLAYEFAKRLRDRMHSIPGAADVVIKQIIDYPTFKVNVDRERAARLGLTERDISSSLLVALSSSTLVSPSYFLNPENGVNYLVVVKVPFAQVTSLPELLRMPITPAEGTGGADLQGGGVAQSVSGAVTADQLPGYPETPSQTIGNLATLEPTTTLNQVNHQDVQRILDVLSGVEGRDLGSVVSDVRKAIKSLGAIPKGLTIHLRGQNEVMEQSFTKLGLGMILAGALVYLLMVTLFQSWLDPFIIMFTLPGAISGILWMLALTKTTLNVESLMGSIMAVGIAVSNANLLVNFANEHRVTDRGTPSEAALEAGKVRLRPVLMTSLAMLLGMIPMALGLGEAGSQNAPLGRAVIGGLLLSTVTTLLVVPVAYSVLRKGMPTKHEIRELYEKEEAEYDSDEERQAGRKSA